MLYHLTKAIIFIVRLLPRRVALALFSAAGFVAGKLHARERAIAAAQLKLACKSNMLKTREASAPLIYRRGGLPATSYYNLPITPSDADINKIVDANFRHAGKIFYESLIVEKLTQLKPHCQDAPLFSEQPYQHVHFLDGAEELDKLLSNDTACFMLSAHLGCFELLAACAAKMKGKHHNQKVYAIGRNPNFAVADRLLKDIRAKYGLETIWRDDKKAGMKLVKTIKQKNWLAFLIDQDTNLQNTFHPFFGLDAAYPSAPLSLAVKHSIPIISIFIIREPDNKHIITARRIHYDPSSANVEQEILKAYSEHLESALLEYPEQWVWWHRRWRRRPEGGKPPRTNEYIAWLNELVNRP